MKAVILAGGLGTRISEETVSKPKPMVEIGGKPILWHIMKIYSNYGINEFIICCGYKGYVIKNFFSNYSGANAAVPARCARAVPSAAACRTRVSARVTSEVQFSLKLEA